MEIRRALTFEDIVASAFANPWVSRFLSGAMSFFRASDSPSSDRISGASKDELFADVESFVASNGLANEQSLFLKAALVLQGEAAHESIPGITPAEIEALSRESERKWRQPWTLYFTIFVCSLGAIEQGWAQTSTNGATLFFPKYMGIDSTSTHDTLLVGLINAGIYISTGLLYAPPTSTIEPAGIVDMTLAAPGSQIRSTISLGEGALSSLAAFSA